MQAGTAERMLITGHTRYGKSEFGRFLVGSAIRGGARVLVIDPKGSRPMRQLAPRLWTPRADWPAGLALRVQGLNPYAWDDSLQEAFLRGNILVFVDELHLVASEHSFPEGLKMCWIAGAERGVGVWSVTQRPSRIPLWSKTETDHLVTFMLGLPEDRDELARASQSADWSEAATLPRFHSLHWQAPMTKPEHQNPIPFQGGSRHDEASGDSDPRPVRGGRSRSGAKDDGHGRPRAASRRNGVGH